jgi:hypothetical protein
MRVGEILSELKKQRRRLDRAIAVLEMLEPQPTRRRKKRTGNRKSKSGAERSGKVHRLSKRKEDLATEAVGSSARVIPFGRLRQRA